jgi:DNA invertase Pin-like site-specific DNA recombinase
MNFIAYYRVSTEKQHMSGLGLEAQVEAVRRCIGSGQLVGSYQDIESGKRSVNRPQLLAALAECRRTHSTLVVAKLDRLSRNLAFIATLLESSVSFVCCDIPQANKLTLQLLACVAEHEREQISARTKAALQAAKARGVKLGNPDMKALCESARASHRAHSPVSEILDMMRAWRNQGASFREIANRLNRLSVRPARGLAWYGSTVRLQIGRAA